MHNTIKVFPVGKKPWWSVGSREMGQLSVEKYVLLDDIHLAGCDLEFAQKDLEEFTLRGGTEGGFMGVRGVPNEKPTRCECQMGWGRDGMGDADNWIVWRKITVSRGEINNKPGQIYPYKSRGSRCRPSCPLLFARLLLLSTYGIHEAESLSQPLPSRVSYRGLESS